MFCANLSANTAVWRHHVFLTDMPIFDNVVSSESCKYPYLWKWEASSVVQKSVHIRELNSMAGCHPKVLSLSSLKPSEFVWNNGFVPVPPRNKWCCRVDYFGGHARSNRPANLPGNLKCSGAPPRCDGDGREQGIGCVCGRTRAQGSIWHDGRGEDCNRHLAKGPRTGEAPMWWECI